MRIANLDFVAQAMDWGPPEFLLRTLDYFCHLGPTGTYRDIFMWHSKHQKIDLRNFLIRNDFQHLGFPGEFLREQFLRAAPGKLASVTKAAGLRNSPEKQNH
jgi:hypothetical protein